MRVKRFLKSTPVINIPYQLYRGFIEKKRVYLTTERRIKRIGLLKDERTYYIIRRFHKAGFFSNFIFVLGHIIYADKNNWIPVVDMEKYPTLYNEPYKLFGTKNAWEYYFAQPSKCTLHAAYRKKNIVLSSGELRYDESPYYTGEEKRFPDRELVQKMIPYLDKYISVNDNIQNVAQNIFNSWREGNSRIIGVHIRGTDMKATPNHPIPPTVDDYIDELMHLRKSNVFDKIFVCTDETTILNRMKQVFGENICSLDVFRSSDGNSIHKGHHSEVRKDHHYKMGKEVLLDALLLSYCDSIICGHSNVSYAAIIFNRNKYRFVKLIENPEQDANRKQSTILNN